MPVEGLCRRGGISILEGVGDTLLREAVRVRDAAPLTAEVEVRRAPQEAIPVEDGKGPPNGTAIALGDGAVSKKFSGLVGAQTEVFGEKLKDSQLRLSAVR